MKEVSIILLDWKVRESFHILDYLNQQTVPRSNYEIIWIEYYNRKPKELEEKFQDSLNKRKPILDEWIVMKMPENVYYHKHLMYNLGIIAAEGKIITFCDSDAIVKPTFIESIVNSFREDENIVLHMDEIRNDDRNLYPFCYPSIARIEGEGCINIKEGRPVGIMDRIDPLHLKNYGACMSALKEDLIEIGGADEHLDYLGHIAGPYELTFRLRNYGRREIWHQSEWLYHTWHPSQGGEGNFLGPHDGYNMSTTALNILISVRIEPLQENPAIKVLRNHRNFEKRSLLSLAMSQESIIEEWKPEKIKKRKNRYFFLFHLRMYLLFQKLFQKIYSLNLIDSFSSFKKKIKKAVNELKEKSLISKFTIISLKVIRWICRYIYYKIRKYYKIGKFWDKIGKFWREPYRVYKGSMENCWHFVYNHLIFNNINEIAFYGYNPITKFLLLACRQVGIKVVGIYGDKERRGIFGYQILPLLALKDYQGKILIVSSLNLYLYSDRIIKRWERYVKMIQGKIDNLKKLGIKEENILLN